MTAAGIHVRLTAMPPVAVDSPCEATSDCAAIVNAGSCDAWLYDGFAAGRSLAVLGNCYVIGVSNMQKGHPAVPFLVLTPTFIDGINERSHDFDAAIG